MKSSVYRQARDSKPLRYCVEPSKPSIVKITPEQIHAAQLRTASYAIREELTKEQLKELLVMLGVGEVITEE